MADDRGSDSDGEPTLDERLQEIEDEVTAKIADVRQRIVQIKMEIDEKAPADHDHEALAERLDALETAVEALDPVDPETLERVETAVEDHADTLETQAEALDGLADDVEDLREKAGMLASASVDVQDRLDELEDTLEDHDTVLGSAEEKLDMVASSTLDVQDRLEALTDRARDRDALDELRAAANEKRVRRARCGACSARLDVGLLTATDCPECGESFVDVEAGGLLRRGRLVTDPRAGGVVGPSPDEDRPGAADGAEDPAA